MATYATDTKNEKPTPIVGHEELVEEYVVRAKAFKLEKSKLDKIKEKLRSAAYSAIFLGGRSLFGGRRYSLSTKSGDEPVLVTLPDPAAKTNRLTLTDKRIAALAELIDGGDISKLIESEKTITLTGSWVAWFDTAMEQLKAGGAEIQDDKANGVDRRESRRMTVEGVKYLEDLAAKGTADQQERAQALLLSLLKDPPVVVR